MIRVLRLYLKYLGVHLLCKDYTLLMVIWKVCSQLSLQNTGYLNFDSQLLLITQFALNKSTFYSIFQNGSLIMIHSSTLLNIFQLNCYVVENYLKVMLIKTKKEQKSLLEILFHISFTMVHRYLVARINRINKVFTSASEMILTNKF